MPTTATNFSATPSAKASPSSAASSTARATAVRRRSHGLPPPKETSSATPARALAKTEFFRRWGPERTKCWFGGIVGASAATFFANFSSASLTAADDLPPGRKWTLRHHVTFFGSRNGGVENDSSARRRSASWRSSLVAVIESISSSPTPSPTVLRAASSTR